MNYLSAKNEIRQVETYAMDLLWVCARDRLAKTPPMPSEIWSGKNKIDRRSGKQIINDLIKGLGGE